MPTRILRSETGCQTLLGPFGRLHARLRRGSSRRGPGPRPSCAIRRPPRPPTIPNRPCRNERREANGSMVRTSVAADWKMLVRACPGTPPGSRRVASYPNGAGFSIVPLDCVIFAPLQNVGWVGAASPTIGFSRISVGLTALDPPYKPPCVASSDEVSPRTIAGPVSRRVYSPIATADLPSSRDHPMDAPVN